MLRDSGGFCYAPGMKQPTREGLGWKPKRGQPGLGDRIVVGAINVASVLFLITLAAQLAGQVAERLR